MRSLENKIIRKIDNPNFPTKTNLEEQGRTAEKVVIDFLRSNIGMDVRAATPLEDSGVQGIVKDQAIDAVGYLEGRPAIGFQITTAIDSEVRRKKTNDLLNRPFIRLSSEMISTDTAIPRVLVFVDGNEAKTFFSDHKIEKHPKLAEQVIESTVNSLKLDLMKTKNPKEQELIRKLMNLFVESKKFIGKEEKEWVH